MIAILALRRWRQEAQEFKTTLSYHKVLSKKEKKNCGVSIGGVGEFMMSLLWGRGRCLEELAGEIKHA